MHGALRVILVVLGSGAWLVTPLPLIPAMEALLALVLWAWLAAGRPFGWIPPLFALVIWALTAWVEHLVRKGSLERAGARKGSAVVALLGAIVGVMVWGPWGLPLGVFVGAFLWEMWGGGDGKKSLASGKAALLGVLASGAGRFAMGALLLGEIILLVIL
ncbi:DUF456 domain-containing protein [bacterium]|nr:DUF456 domain-containing protein [bacterium]